jgi:hypothetical protein
MKRRTVVETPSYIVLAAKFLSERERDNIVAKVAEDPRCGDVMSGTGGFRKVRVPRQGMGKSGGARAVYIWRNDKFPGLPDYSFSEEPEGQFD